MQQIEIIGRLTDNAQIRVSKDGNEFLSFVVATSNIPKRSDEDVVYHSVMTSNTKLVQKLTKGTQVYISGPLSITLNETETKTYLNTRIQARLLEVLQQAQGKPDKYEALMGDKIDIETI